MVCENINSSHKLKIDYPSKNLNKSRNLILKLLFLEIICLGLLRLATLRQLEVSRALSIIKNHPKVLLISLTSEFTVFRKIFRVYCNTYKSWFYLTFSNRASFLKTNHFYRKLDILTHFKKEFLRSFPRN